MAYKPSPAQPQRTFDVRRREMGSVVKEPKPKGKPVHEVYPHQPRDNWQPWRWYGKSDQEAPIARNPDDPTEPPEWFCEEYEKQKKEEAMSNFISSKKALARELGVSAPTVSRWVDSDWFPKEVEGWGWNLDEAKEAVANRPDKRKKKQAEELPEESNEDEVTEEELASNCYHCGEPLCSGDKETGKGCETDPNWLQEEDDEEAEEFDDVHDEDEEEPQEPGIDLRAARIEGLCQIFELRILLGRFQAPDAESQNKLNAILDAMTEEAKYMAINC